MATGLSSGSPAVKPVIEPAQDGAWILKMRSVQATSSGVPRQRAFYTAAAREARLVIHTASVRDCERTLEEDEARLRRDVSLFNSRASQAEGPRRLGLGQRLLELALPGLVLGQPRLRRAERPAAPPAAGDWSEGSISVNGKPTPIRAARISGRGWVGWWTSGDQIVEVQSDAVPADDISLIHHHS